MDSWVPFGGTAAFMALAISLVVTLLKMRRDEIRDMQDRIRRVERQNTRCNIVQSRLVAVLYDNHLSIPEGTFVVHLEDDDDEEATA